MRNVVLINNNNRTESVNVSKPISGQSSGGYKMGVLARNELNLSY